MIERRDEWRSGVDESLIILKASQRVTDQQLDDLDLKYEAIDKVIRGSPEDEIEGLAARFHAVETGLLELRATILKAHMADIEVTKSKWEFAGKIIERLLIIAGLLILGWDRIEGLYQRIIHQKQSPLEMKIEQAKHPKGKPLYRVRRVQAEPPSESTEESDQK